MIFLPEENGNQKPPELGRAEAFAETSVPTHGPSRKVEVILDEYIAMGRGVRQTDAQEYVNDLRKEED